MKHILMMTIAALCLLTAQSCKNETTKTEQPLAVHPRANAVYYWKTIFDLNDKDREFLKHHDIGRMYIRFFDIVKETQGLDENHFEAIPNATIRFDGDSTGVKSIVPVVYITVDALKLMDKDWYAFQLVRRVDNMCSYHNIRNVDELQLDCDWTPQTEELFFNLCRNVKKELGDRKLSATIRLHQLKKTAPPVDYGVLMVYNTGSFRNPKCDNSILSYNDVKPYLTDDISYPLPLDFAYPTFSWDLVYDQDNQFKGIARDSTYRMGPGDRVRRETSKYSEVAKVKKLIEEKLANDSSSVILYHLDSENLSKYTNDEIESLYHIDR